MRALLEVVSVASVVRVSHQKFNYLASCCWAPGLALRSPSEWLLISKFGALRRIKDAALNARQQTSNASARRYFTKSIGIDSSLQKKMLLPLGFDI